MKPCKQHRLSSFDWGKKFWFHSWSEWLDASVTTYKGKQTLVQLRQCKRCYKIQTREC